MVSGSNSTSSPCSDTWRSLVGDLVSQLWFWTSWLEPSSYDKATQSREFVWHVTKPMCTRQSRPSTQDDLRRLCSLLLAERALGALVGLWNVSSAVLACKHVLGFREMVSELNWTGNIQADTRKSRWTSSFCNNNVADQEQIILEKANLEISSLNVWISAVLETVC